MKKIPSYPKITNKTNITVTQTQNININSPKGLTAFNNSKKMFRAPHKSKSHKEAELSEIKMERPKSKVKAESIKGQADHHRRQTISKFSQEYEKIEHKLQNHKCSKGENKEELKRLEDKLKFLEKKIDSLRKKKGLSSQRNKSSVKEKEASPITNKTLLNPYMKVKDSRKQLKKCYSDKNIPKKHSRDFRGDKKSDQNLEQKEAVMHQYITQMQRAETEDKQKGWHQQISEHPPESGCYYIENVKNSVHEHKLIPFRQHLIQSVQTISFLQNIRRPTAKEIEKHSIELSPPKFPLTVVLDLDQTLIHCNESLQVPHDVCLKIKFPTGEKIDAGVNVRPYARELLQELSTFCEVIVFTASHECYANVVLDYLDPDRKLISHRLFRNHCWQTEEGIYIKDLRVLKNRSLDNLLLVDNAAYSYFYQLENGIPIIPFYDDKKDRELVSLLKYLKDIFQLAREDSTYTLQKLNHNYFKLTNYQQYESMESLVDKLYTTVINNFKRIFQ